MVRGDTEVTWSMGRLNAKGLAPLHRHSMPGTLTSVDKKLTHVYVHVYELLRLHGHAHVSGQRS